MKKVLFVIPTMRFGGAEKSLVSLLKALDPERIQVDLLLFEGDGPLQKEIPSWVNIIEADPITRGMTLELSRYLKDVLKVGALCATFDRIRISFNARRNKTSFSWNIVKKHIPSFNTEYDVAIGFLEGVTDYYVIDKVNAKRKIGWIHIDYTNREMLSEEISYYEEFDYIATISEICKDAFIHLVPNMKDKIFIIENIVIPDEIRQKALEVPVDYWNDGKKHIVTVGRLDYQKGIDIGACVAKELVTRGVDFCWHVYGQGPMKEEINKYIIDNNLEEYYLLEGTRQNPYPYMSKADIIVQPSRYEGKSIVLDEAKILGKAIVVTNYPSVEDQIVDGMNGVIVEMTPEKIAAAISELINSSSKRETLANNCLLEANQSIKSIEKLYTLMEV